MATESPMPVSGEELLECAVNGDVAGLARLALETIQRATGLESTYLTFIDWGADRQMIRYSANAGALRIEEGAVVPWEETLCRRALLSDVRATADVDTTFGVDNAGHALGIVSYVGVPVVTQDRGIYGTLCAASTRSAKVDDKALELLRLFAHLLGRQIDGELSAARERDRAERAERHARSRLMMMAESEHRVKTPLTVIVGVSSMLEQHWDELEDARRREMITSLGRQSADLLECVQVLLAQAREEMDELAVAETAMFVEPVLDQVAKDHGLAAQGHTITAMTDGPVIARTDVVSLRQMLGHLIDNAVKYTPAGGTIMHAARTEGARAVVTVADDGPGLPEGLDPFAEFSRGEASESMAIGSGLGLSIVRRIARRLGGEVFAHNAEGGGAVFVIDLPGA